MLRAVVLGVALAVGLLGITSRAGHADQPPQHVLLWTAAQENHNRTEVTFPLHQGTSRGRTVYYVITDTSDATLSALLGVNYAPKLADARGTAAVQQISAAGFPGAIDFPASVHFGQQRILVPSDTGFPPAQAQPGASGEDGYSPLIALPNGVVVNAPQVANDSGRADKALNLDLSAMTVTWVETKGFVGHAAVFYASFDASAQAAAAIEDVTYAPALNAAPTLNDEGTDGSAREGLLAFTNGQLLTPERQGLNAALQEQLPPSLAPLNIVHAVPQPGDGTAGAAAYSPLWDVHLTSWTAAAVSSHKDLLQTDFDEVAALAQQGLVEGFPAGTPFGASGIVANCPVVSRDTPASSADLGRGSDLRVPER
jgi:hypothetical protein